MQSFIWILLVISIKSIVSAAHSVEAVEEYTKVTDLTPSVPSLGLQPAYSKLDNNDNNFSNNSEQLGEQFTVPKHDRKTQLPVTTSHLKRPAIGVVDDEPAEEPTNSTNQTDVESVIQKSGGAKSLVSPSVSTDESLPNPNLKKKVFVNPDVLELSQIMNGVTNASAVPAVVNREYGHHTRTRITIGGGYVRDRLPPLVNPVSTDDRLEKPYVPLEKPKLIIKEEPSSPEVTVSVSEVPDKISLPAEEFVTQLGDSNKSASTINATTTVTHSGKLDSRCPKTGVKTYEHPTACDKYFYCEDGYIHELTCPNGLMYGIRDMIKDYCVHRWKADCQDKSMPNPMSSPGCRWQYGIFNVQGSPKCSPDYYECTAGKFEVKKCAIDGQVYDDRTKSCMFAEQVGCANEVLADFHCPVDDQSNTYWPFPRYFLNERALIHCINDKPEIVRCTENERVDPEHLHCIPVSKVILDVRSKRLSN